VTDLRAIADEQLAKARQAPRGRSAVLVLHDGAMRQTMMALRAGSELAEHNAPLAASIQVFDGTITVTASTDVTITAGELAAIPQERHGVTAVEDAVFLLTTVTEGS